MSAIRRYAPNSVIVHGNGAFVLYADHVAALTAEQQAHQWQPIETAPKDGTEIIGWRKDCGPILVRWTSCDAFCTEAELEELNEEEAFTQDWFYADFVAGGRLEGSEVPTHWMPLPGDPA